jgi:hypothetical protein
MELRSKTKPIIKDEIDDEIEQIDKSFHQERKEKMFSGFSQKLREKKKQEEKQKDTSPNIVSNLEFSPGETKFQAFATRLKKSKVAETKSHAVKDDLFEKSKPFIETESNLEHLAVLMPLQMKFSFNTEIQPFLNDGMATGMNSISKFLEGDYVAEREKITTLWKKEGFEAIMSDCLLYCSQNEFIGSGLALKPSKHPFAMKGNMDTKSKSKRPHALGLFAVLRNQYEHVLPASLLGTEKVSEIKPYEYLKSDYFLFQKKQYFANDKSNGIAFRVGDTIPFLTFNNESEIFQNPAVIPSKDRTKFPGRCFYFFSSKDPIGPIVEKRKPAKFSFSITQYFENFNIFIEEIFKLKKISVSKDFQKSNRFKDELMSKIGIFINPGSQSNFNVDLKISFVVSKTSKKGMYEFLPSLHFEVTKEIFVGDEILLNPIHFKFSENERFAVNFSSLKSNDLFQKQTKS